MDTLEATEHLQFPSSSVGSVRGSSGEFIQARGRLDELESQAPEEPDYKPPHNGDMPPQGQKTEPAKLEEPRGNKTLWRRLHSLMPKTTGTPRQKQNSPNMQSHMVQESSIHLLLYQKSLISMKTTDDTIYLGLLDFALTYCTTSLC